MEGRILEGTPFDVMRLLHPYQVAGVRFLRSRQRAYLADQMGLGKTVQALLAAQYLKPDSVLVVAPAVAVPNWHREIQKWITGPLARSVEVVSYSKLIRRAPGSPRSIVILDEAHYCKSPGAKRTRRALSEARRASVAWLLSGTPMPNHPGELWAPIKYLWPEIPLRFGCTTAFEWLDHFTTWRPTDWGPRPYGVRNGAELRAAIKPLLLRRKLEDVGLELPPLRVHLDRLPLDGYLREALEQYKTEEAYEEAYTSHLRRLLGEGKAEAIARQIVRELDDKLYQKIVVLYYHRNVGQMLRDHFEPFGVVGFDGSTPGNERMAEIDKFQEGTARVFLAQQSAAGVAINLTAASEVVLVEPAWSPDDNAQAIARIHRIGQESPCRARIFAVSGTLDEAIMQTLANKTAMQGEVFDNA